MKLTVGPLPPAVYWRRRAVVAGALVGAILLLVAILRNGGGTPSGRGPSPNATVDSPAPGSSTLYPVEPGGSPTAEPSGAYGGAGAPGNGSGGAPGDGSGGDTGSGPGVATSAGPCSDADMQVTTAADPPAPLVGEPTLITIKIRNSSTRSCTRDVGAGPQELRIMQGTTLIWSSDHCQSTAGGSDVRTFGPGVQTTFYVTWDGHSTKPGCVRSKDPVPAAAYQVVARLGTKYSEPEALAVVPPGS